MRKQEGRDFPREKSDTLWRLFRSKKSLILLAAVIVAVCVLLIWNTLSLQRAITHRTEMYVNGVALQLASDLDNRLTKVTVDLEMLADSVIRIEEDQGQETAVCSFLERKAAILDFTALAVIKENGDMLCSQEVKGDWHELPGITASFQGENGVSFVEGRGILYSIPLIREDSVVGVLAGLRDEENMQRLIQPESFYGRGLSCIVDTGGNVLISPTDIEPFKELEDIFREGEAPAVQDIRQMQENMKRQESGIFSFTAVDGSNLVLSYFPLRTYGWVLLTLVPSDVISAEVENFITQTVCIVVVVILLFVAILVAFFQIYRNHFRQMERVAFVDPLTGGGNNAAFQLRCRQLLAAAPPGTFTVVLLNVKDFKLINENFGSEEGDRTLTYIMNCLNKAVGPEEAAARADADLFFLCLKEKDPETIRSRLKALSETVNAFNRTLSTPYYLILQPGAYIVDDPALEVTVIQDRAKTACRNRMADQDGECVFYDAAFTQRLQKERDLNALFEGSLENGDFQVYLQPKVWVENGSLGGAEALVRWNHPQRGMIYPSDFISLFEKNGKICRLDFYVFEEVCRAIHRWARNGMRLFPVSVNLSRQHFDDPEVLLKFKDIADRYEIPAGLLELELTESIFFDDQRIENVKHQIRKMHRLGFRCSLDDFGAGYSSLGLLMEFDVDAVKLDRRFFLDVSREKTQVVVRSIVELAEKLGADIVAEGIETPEQLAFLKTVGCRLVQGYIFSKPLPLPEFEERWISRDEK